MTGQHVAQEPVVTETPEQLEQLRRTADDLSTAALTARAKSLGLVPPTADDRWEMVVYFRDDHDVDGALAWVLVTETDDE